ncbi:phosphotransferase [bacterium]|nr:phosphotransferase [bacterium]
MAQTVSSRFIDYKKVIEAVFNPNPHLPCTELYKGGSTKVYRVDTPQPLVVRIAPGDKDYYEFQAQLLEAIADGDDMTARVLHWEMREIDHQARGIQIQTYLPGTPLDHYPHPVESRAIVKATYVLHERLCAVSNRFACKGIPTIEEACKNLLDMVDDCPMTEAAGRLLTDERYNELVAQEEHYLIYCDLWHQNLLFDYTNEEMRVRIVDVDPLLFGPKILQPAMLFSSCFLVSSLLYASDSSHAFDLNEVIGYWPEPINQQDVLLMMQIFPIILGLHKAYQFAHNPSVVPEAYQSNMKLYKKCLQVIWELRA